MNTEKYCKRCDQTLPVDSFTPSKARYDGLQNYCRECMKKYRIEHYRANKEQYQNRNNKTYARLRDMVLDLKAGPCVDCGVRYPGEPWLLEFDHLDASLKVNSISYFVANGSQKRLEGELAKCDLVCVVCHRRRTAQRGGWLDNRLAGVLD